MKSTTKQRNSLIRESRRGLLIQTRRVQRQFQDVVTQYLSGNLTLGEGGKLITSPENMRVINRLNIVVEGFTRGPISNLLQWMGERMQRIEEINARYFSSVSTVAPTTTTKVSELLGAKYGLRGGQVVQGGLLASLGGLAAQEAYATVKRAALNAIGQGLSYGSFQQSLIQTIAGGGGKLGLLEGPIYTAAYDAFQQYDREVQRQYATELDLGYAIYSGDIRDTSRDWCRRWIGQVLTREEIEEWATKDWQGKSSPYDPFIDCGGYNCTHIWNWISYELAVQLRPELERQ